MGGWFASRHSLGHAIARFARRAGAEYTGRSIGTGLVARSRISVGKAISLAGCAATFFAAGNAIQVSHCAGDKDGDAKAVRKQFRYLIADAVDKVAPSVVKISCLRRHGWGLAESSGSGFIFEEGGSILTNAHVVEGAEELTVLLKDGSELEGQVEHIDELGDVAVVKIKPSKKLPTAVFGQSGSLRVGEFIIAVGAPAALQDTCTLGIVSALQRPSSELGMSARRMSYIQTDAAINQGNSGGPLVNVDGEVVAVSVLKASNLDGVSFGIPIDTVVEMVRQMRKFGKVLRPVLGVRMISLDAETAAVIRSRNPSALPPDLTRGVIITHVAESSPAHKGGIKPGDVLIEMDSASVTHTAQVYNLLGLQVGRKIPVKVVRGQKQLSLNIVTEASKL